VDAATLRGPLRVGSGEEARLTPGAAADAEVWSRGFLPLRPRSTGSYRLRAPFPGTAVVLGARTFEVISETELPEDGLVVYRMRAWPEGEVVRDRVVYGRAFVRAAEAERERARVRARARPYRYLLYPFVGLLPEEEQLRIADRLGLYAVTATLVSGLAEGLLILAVPVWLSRLGAGQAIVAVTTSVAFAMLALPAFGRAFAALLLRETAGSAIVAPAFELLRGRSRGRPRDLTVLPLTRAAFWARLARPDTVARAEDGSLLYAGLLPHLTWTSSRHIAAGGDHWLAAAEHPVLDRGRLVHVYRLTPARGAASGGELEAPSPTAYADEVMEGVRREWDDFNHGFLWLTTLLSRELQERAFDHRGGPAAARSGVYASALGLAAVAVYVLGYPPAPGDPLAPLVAALALLTLVDCGARAAASRRGRYAPSLLRFLVPADLLRPERVAYHAHRDAERRALLARDENS
jgi:hypothetical protein